MLAALRKLIPLPLTLALLPLIVSQDRQEEEPQATPSPSDTRLFSDAVCAYPSHRTTGRGEV